MKKSIAMICAVLLMVVALVGCQDTKKTDVVENDTTMKPSGISIKDVNQEYTLIDARSSNAFNGWQLENESRGGHVENAMLFSASWIGNMSDEEITEYFTLRSVTADTKLAIYGYGDDAKSVSDLLTSKGYATTVINETFADIANDSTIVLETLANYQVLVPASYVKSIIDGQIPEELAGKTIKIFEASWGPGDKYAEGHIPTAVHINTDEVEEGPLWNRVDDERLLGMLKNNGVTKDTVVIVYGEDTTPAARVGLLMKYLGVEDVRLLDGGYQAWKAAGYQIDKGMVEKVAVTETGLAVAENSHLVIDLDEAKEIVANEDGRLISVRSWDEFIGETSGYDYIEAAGRIDGAVYGYAGLNPWNMADYRTADNTMIDYTFIQDRWASMGITKDTTNAFYCGTGWRAAETWFYAYAMGWENIALYDGGWKEWSEAGEPMLKGLPATGVPAGK